MVIVVLGLVDEDGNKLEGEGPNFNIFVFIIVLLFFKI